MSKIFYTEKNVQWKGGVVTQGGVIVAKTPKDIKKAENHKRLISEEDFLKNREASLAAQNTTAADKYKEDAERLQAEKEALAEELKALKKAATKAAPAKETPAKETPAKAAPAKTEEKTGDK